MFRLHRQLHVQLDVLMALVRDHGETPQERRQHDLHLLPGELLTDAISLAGGERDEGERVPADGVFGAETIRVKGVRVLPVARMPVDAVDGDNDGGTGRDHTAVSKVDGFCEKSVRVRSDGQEALTLLDHLVHVG